MGCWKTSIFRRLGVRARLRLVPITRPFLFLPGGLQSALALVRRMVVDGWPGFPSEEETYSRRWSTALQFYAGQISSAVLLRI